MPYAEEEPKHLYNDGSQKIKLIMNERSLYLCNAVSRNSLLLNT